MQTNFIPCGGCGAEHPNERCIGCFHDFGELAVAQSRFAELEQRAQRLAARWRMLTSELDKSVVETVERVSDENAQLKASRDAWEKHYNEMANNKDAEIARLRSLCQKAHDEFAKTDHWYHSDIKDELAKELGP